MSRSRRASGRTLCFLTSLVVVMGWASSAPAQWARQGAVRTIIEENDLIVNTDRHYTQGMKRTFLQADDDLPPWMTRFADGIRRIGLSHGPNKLGGA